ncbi:MAG: glycosyltransferase family 2 protein [Methanobacteriales archaeon HGW-Methanobacteriales-1]|jgi:glycosyltransferase involved in cell wall biosynthesis|nr:MAG: glycosyltransferase family 2 protein [Methanobacteriales archaeon HGW-Methanobacteriales-1]
MKISIVIPALNEEGIVGNTVQSIPVQNLKEMGLETEIIVVDNASTDNTSQEASAAGATVIYEEKKGYGNAYLRGLREASGDIIVMGDADGTYPFDQTHEFIKPILTEDYEFVMGNRLNGHMEKGAMPSLHKYIGNPMLTRMLNVLFKSDLSDTHCGMRAFKKEVLEKINLQSPGMEFAIEMVIEIAENDIKVKEVPIEYRVRGGEAKLSSFKDGWRHVNYMFNRKFLKKSKYSDNELNSLSIIRK